VDGPHGLDVMVHICYATIMTSDVSLNHVEHTVSENILKVVHLKGHYLEHKIHIPLLLHHISYSLIYNVSKELCYCDRL
jgi:hypothetical protein